MKRYIFVVLLVAVILVATTFTIRAAPIIQDEQFADLAVTDISWVPDTVNPGNQVEFTIAYENLGQVPVPEGTQVDYELFLTRIGDPPEKKVGESLRGELPEAVGLSSRHTGSVTGTLIAPAEGHYTVHAILATETGIESEQGQENNTRTEPFQVKSVLPPGLTQLFAGLGIFAAVMAIMAVGTEVVIDSLKLFIGMKRKVTALEAMDKLKQELPGQLDDLGVQDWQLKEIDNLFEKLGTTLTPVTTAAQIPQQVRDGDFCAVFETIETHSTAISAKANAGLDELKTKTKAEILKLQQKIGFDPAVENRLETLIDDVDLNTMATLAEDIRQSLEDENLKLDSFEAVKTVIEAQLSNLKAKADDGLNNLKNDVKGKIYEAANMLQKRLNLGRETTKAFEQGLTQLIDAIDVQSLITLPQTMFETLQKQASPVTEEWLKAQTKLLGIQGRNVVVVHMENDVIPTLQSLGFTKDSIISMQSSVEDVLDEADRLFLNATNSYVIAVRNLLGAVEERRNAMQSPLRKIYRRLRDSRLSVWAVIVGVVSGILVALLSHYLAIAVVNWFWGFTIALVVGLLLSGLVGWATSHTKTEPQAGTGTLGETLRQVEKGINIILGRDNQPPDQYGEVPLEVRREIHRTDATTIAQVLLDRDDKHRDAEATRLRILRLISIVVGIILAYLLQIDAAVLLERAIPGSSQINVMLSIEGETLRQYWSVLPEANKLTAGIILTGLAASAGSAFWHDILGRLQVARKQAEGVTKLAQQAKDLTGQN